MEEQLQQAMQQIAEQVCNEFGLDVNTVYELLIDICERSMVSDR